MDNNTSDESIKYIYNLFTGKWDPLVDGSALREGAANMHKIFKALIDGGFKESQAIQILVGFLIAVSRK